MNQTNCIDPVVTNDGSTKTKTILKASFKCSSDYRKEFVTSTAQLTISVGQSIHEGERIQSITHLVNRSFAECKIMIDDSIQSYTHAIAAPHKSKQELLAEAIKAGDEYLERTLPIFEQNFTIPFEIIRWKDWVGTPQWRDAIDRMHETYNDHLEFRQGIDACVNTFLDRYEKIRSLVNYERSRGKELCTQYLLEECAVMKDLWIKHGCHFEVYPSPRNEAMEVTYKLFIEPHYPHLLRAVATRFHRKNIEPV